MMTRNIEIEAWLASGRDQAYIDYHGNEQWAIRWPVVFG
jgi:hypothetical protein